MPSFRRILGVCAGAALVVLFGFVPAAGAATKYMLVDSARLASLPTSGSAYTSMKRTADDAIATMSLTTPTATSPWLPDYNGKGGATLAAALMYARTGDVRYRDFVIKVNRFVIGSEDGDSTKGTSNADKLLATMRQISAYVLAADLVGMDPDVTGSRPGYTKRVWKTWLGELRTKPIGAGNCSTIVDCNLRANNWGTWASAARTTIDVYLNDSADLGVAVGRLKLWLGESMTGTPWNKTQAFDASWACIPVGLPVAFVPVNGKSCGPEKDGIIVEDAARSAHAFSTWDQPSIDYSLHAYMAQLVAAVVLDRQGYDVWNWGDQALKRVMDRLNRIGTGVATGNKRITASHISWIPRYFYSTDYPTIPAQPSDTLGYTDWLYGTATFTFGKLIRSARAGTAILVVRVPGSGKLVLSGRGLRKVTKTTPRAGKVKLRIRPTSTTGALLRRTGRAKVRVKVRFSLPDDAPQVRFKTITLLKTRR